MIQNFGHGPTSLNRDVFRGHAAANGIFGVTEEVGGDLALGGRKEVEQLLRGGGGQFLEEGGAIVGRQFVQDLRDLFVSESVQHFLLILHGEILEDLGGHVVRKDAHEHGFLVRAEIGKDFRDIGRGEFGENSRSWAKSRWRINSINSGWSRLPIMLAPLKRGRWGLPRNKKGAWTIEWTWNLTLRSRQATVMS